MSFLCHQKRHKNVGQKSKEESRRIQRLENTTEQEGRKQSRTEKKGREG